MPTSCAGITVSSLHFLKCVSPTRKLNSPTYSHLHLPHLRPPLLRPGLPPSPNFSLFSLHTQLTTSMSFSSAFDAMDQLMKQLQPFPCFSLYVLHGLSSYPRGPHLRNFMGRSSSHSVPADSISNFLLSSLTASTLSGLLLRSYLQSN